MQKRDERLTYHLFVDTAPPSKRHHQASEELEYLSPVDQGESWCNRVNCFMQALIFQQSPQVLQPTPHLTTIKTVYRRSITHMHCWSTQSMRRPTVRWKNCNLSHFHGTKPCCSMPALARTKQWCTLPCRNRRSSMSALGSFTARDCL